MNQHNSLGCRNPLSWCLLVAGLLLLPVTWTANGLGSQSLAAAESINHPRLAQDQASGLWVVLGVRDAQLLRDLAAHNAASGNRALIQGLTTDEAIATTVRQDLAAAGLIPQVDVRLVPDYQHLPYTNELASVVVIDQAGLAGQNVPEAEITRIAFFRASRRSRQWQLDHDAYCHAG